MPTMGKASKWIRNFLLGKRDHQENKNEDEEKKKKKKQVMISSSLHEEDLLGSSSPKAILSVNKEKRRWSFRKSVTTTTTDKMARRNRSFDSLSTVQLVKQVLEEHEIEQIRIKAVFFKTCNQVINGSNGFHPTTGISLVSTATPKTPAIKPLFKDDDDDAAVKIQSAFRSYLARKALRALRALVKLQALVRGHLVRKQTTAVLRSMHALMTIQVRARYKRVQMVEAAEGSVNRAYLGGSDPWLPNKILRNDLDKVNGHEAGRRRLLSKSGPLDNIPQAAETERMEQGLISRCHSSRLSTCKEEDDDDQHFDDDNHPSYMSKTESSKAKARSQSEPKQRPKWASKPQKGR